MVDKITHYVEERFEFGSERPPASSNVMQVVYLNNVPYGAEFVCPCGCGNRTWQPFIHPENPEVVEGEKMDRWGYSPGPTLHGSVKWRGGCKAHFVITNGNVEMCSDSGQ